METNVTNMKKQVIDFNQTNSVAAIATSNLIQTAEKINDNTLGLYNQTKVIKSTIDTNILQAQDYLDATDQQVITMTELEGNLNKMTTMVVNSTKITLDKASEVELAKQSVIDNKNN